MAINEIPDSKPQAPNNLTEVADSKPAAPSNLTKQSAVTPAAPTNLTEVSESTPAAPTNLAEVAESAPAAPNNLTKLSASTPVAPTNLTEVAESTPAAPNTVSGTAENLFTYSEQLNNANWSLGSVGAGSNPIVTANTGTAPNGSATADQVSFSISSDDIANRSFIRQNKTTESGVTYTVSGWIRKVSGSATGLSFHRLGGTTAAFTLSSDWQRFSASFTGDGLNTAFGFELRGGLGAGGADIVVEIWGAQLNRGAISPYIKTEASSLIAGEMGAPSNLTELAASIPAAPTNLTEVSNSAPAAPNVLSLTENQVVPRTLYPRVDLNFAADSYEINNVVKSISDAVTYTRSSSATYIERFRNQFGQFDYRLATDYVGTVTNLVTYSEQFDNAAWTKAESTVIANKDIAPDGTRTADRLFDTTNNANHVLTAAASTVTSGATVTLSIYAKAGTLSSFTLFEVQSNDGVRVDLNSGVATNIFGSGDLYSIVYDGNGWYRVSLTVTVPATTATFRLYTKQETPAYVGAGEYISIWGAQLTESTKPLPYVKTTTTSASETFTASPRLAYDAATGAALGYLAEGSTTNLADRSEEFSSAAWNALNVTVTDNQAVAPDGTKSADKIIATSASGVHRLANSVTSSTGSKHTSSVYVKKADLDYVGFGFSDAAAEYAIAVFQFSTESVTLGGSYGTNLSNPTVSYKAVGNGWYRIDITADYNSGSLTAYVRLLNNAGSDSFAGDGTSGTYFWGAQTEAQPFATSYVRTEGSTVSRSADNGSLNQPLFPDNAFSIHIKADAPSASIASGANRYLYYHSGSGSSVSYILLNGSNGALQCRHGINVFTVENSPADSFNVTLAYSGNTLSIYYNGALVSNETTIFENAITQPIDIGRITTVQHLFGYIKELTLYDKALTAQEVSLL